MNIENINISELKPYDKNARKHPDKQIDLLVKNIEKFGFTTPLLIDKDNEIIAGHGRLTAAQKIGMAELPCVRMEKLSKEEAEALRLADNKLAELAEWDMDLALEGLKGLDDDLMELTGFDRDLLIEPDEKDDEVPDVPEEPKSKLGDLYELGNHRVLCGDSTKVEDVEKLMDGKKADMVLTDPPYGMNLDTDYSKRNSTGKDYNGLGTKFGTRGKYSEVIGDDKEYNPQHIFDFFPDVKEMFLWGGDYYAHLIPDRDKGSWYVWDKRFGIEGIKFTASEFEMCWSKKKHLREIIRERWFGAHGTQNQDQKKRSHPTQKPLGVNEFFIKKFTKKTSDIIADLFLGTGACLIASEKWGRICYGMELDPKYVDVVVQRYVDYTGNTTIIKNGQEEVWEKTVAKTQE